MAKPPHTRAAMRALYPVCQVAELTAGYRDTTAAWHKEVCHAEVVYRSTDEARTSRAAERCQKAQGHRTESSTCSDVAQGRRRWSKLDRRAHRRGLRVSDENR